MAKISDVAGSSNIWLGSKANSQQSILYIPASSVAGGNTADKPGLLFLEAVDYLGAIDTGLYLWADSDGLLRYSATYPTNENSSGTTISGDTDALVGIDSGAVAGYLGAAIGDGVLRFTTNEFTLADGGNYVTLSLADHGTARTALGLEIAADVQAYDAGLTNLAAVAMVADRYYYTSGDNTHVAAAITSNGRSFLAAADYAAQLALLSGDAGASFAWNSQSLTGVNDVGCATVSATGAITDGAASTFTTGAAIGALTLGNGAITDSSGTIDFDDENLTTDGDIRITSDSNRIELGVDATDSYIVYNGADLVFYDIGTGAYTLAELAASGGLSPIIAGDMTISDGSLTITDGDNAATVAITNDTITSSDMVTLSAAGILTGAMLHIDADAMTTGQFIECDDGGVQFAVKLGGEIEITGLTDNDMLTIAAGNFLMQDGTLNITDADNDTLVTLVNDTSTSADVISVSADATTTGCLLYLSNSVGGTFSGEYIQCWDGAADDFTVKLNGATAIAGSAHGTDAITITAGDITLTDGFIEAGATASGTGHGHTFATADDGTNDTALVTMSNSVAAFDMPLLQLTGASSGDINTMQITNAGTGYGISETMSLAAGEGVEIIFATGGTHNGIFIDGGTGTYVGADTYGMLKIHQTGTLLHANASAIFVDFDGQPAASGLGYAILVDDDSAAVATTYAVAINSLNNIPLHLESQAATKACLWIETGAQTEAAVVLDGATNDWGGKDDAGLLDITSDANLAHAGSTLLRIASTNVIDAAEGGLARFVDTAAVSGGNLSYAVEIFSNANHALHVSKGKCVFEDAIIFEGNAYDVTDLATPPSQANCVTMFGAAGTQGAMYLYDDNDAGTGVYIIIDDGGDYHYIASTQAA